MRKLVVLLSSLSCFISLSQISNGKRAVQQFGFWDNQYKEPVIISNDSLRYCDKNLTSPKSLASSA